MLSPCARLIRWLGETGRAGQYMVIACSNRAALFRWLSIGGRYT
jgi:hypothetical protein